MMISDSVRTYTAEDLWAMSHDPDYAGVRLELSHGRLIVMSPAGIKHGKVSLSFGRILGNFVDQHDLGLVVGAETGFILYKNPDPDGKDTVRAPDVGFIVAARVPDPLPDGYAPFAPDLAVEVISPSETADEIQEKVNDYLQYGTRAVWLFFSKSKTVVTHTPDGSKTLHANSILDGGDIVPGFRIKVSDIFK